jgi:hypothetical protein
MKNLILSLFVSVFLFVSSVSFIPNNAFSSVNKIECKVYGEDPVELWREYVFDGDQWYLIIHYSDGTIGVTPVYTYPLE